MNDPREVIERAIDEHRLHIPGDVGGYRCDCRQWSRPEGDDDARDLFKAHRADAVRAALVDAGLLTVPGTNGDAEAWQHNAKLHNDMRRRIQQVATHAAADQRTLSWVADELVDILNDPKAWHGETVDADQIAALRDGLTARHIVPGDNPAADALAAIDTARAERDARTSVLKDVIAQREQAIRTREIAGTEAARALAQAERERDEAQEKLRLLDKHTGTWYAQQWARLAKGLRDRGITDGLVGLEKAVTVTLDTFDRTRKDLDLNKAGWTAEIQRTKALEAEKATAQHAADERAGKLADAMLTRSQQLHHLRAEVDRIADDMHDERQALFDPGLGSGPALRVYGSRLRALTATAPATQDEPAPVADDRDPACVQRWPECTVGGHDPRCCRFPKSCSCRSYTAPAAGDAAEPDFPPGPLPGHRLDGHATVKPEPGSQP